LENIKERFKDGASFLKKIVLDPVKFEAIGPNEKTYVLKLQENESIMQLRGFLENCLPGFHQQNLPFVPHITILNHKHFDKHLSFKTPDQKIEPYTAKSVGIYYKTEEGATALLYSHKI
jgi:2'-5' RNA ligase